MPARRLWATLISTWRCYVMEDLLLSFNMWTNCRKTEIISLYFFCQHHFFRKFCKNEIEIEMWLLICFFHLFCNHTLSRINFLITVFWGQDLIFFIILHSSNGFIFLCNHYTQCFLFETACRFAHSALLWCEKMFVAFESLSHQLFCAHLLLPYFTYIKHTLWKNR